MSIEENAVHAGNSFSPMLISDADFQRMVTFVKSNYGIDLSRKRQLITGRLSPTIRKMGYSSFSDFVAHLLEKKDADEITMILNKLTTNYTFFMREQEHLEYFRQRIIPDLIRRHQRDKVLSIWSAGCSSGEEPYNITMYLFDYLGAQARQWDTRILATDISANALASAKKGIYELPETMPADWKRKYFTKNPDGTYTQRGQDVIRQTPFGRMGRAEELCGTIQYLISDAASFVTGTVAVVDGGFNAFAM